MERERGFTLLEMVIAVALTSLVLAAGAWAFAPHPNALGAAANDVDAALAQARAVAASSGNGATLVFAPRTNGNGAALMGFTLRVYRGRPTTASAVSAASVQSVVSDASVRERTLGAPPFALFIDSAGDASGKASYPALSGDGSVSFATIAQEPPCPSGGFTLTFASTESNATMTRTLPCRALPNGALLANPSPTPNLPIVTPTALLFHWPADAQQQFVATEWGYTHWFASTSGFAFGDSTESLSIKNMTRSAKRTIESPGRNVAQKAGLNREILATSPRAFLAMLRYKAAEAGVEYIEVPSRKVKPSQTCSGCGAQRKKALSERQHVYACGVVLSRDQNAARVNLLWALARTGREPTGCLAQSA